MTDWEIFTEDVPWFPDAGSTVRTSERRRGVNLQSPLTEQLPSLSRLLGTADVTPVFVDDVSYHLLGWNGTDGCRIGWLCLPSVPTGVRGIYEEHDRLLRTFGGIVERFNEPADTWLLNHNDVLTEREAAHDASFLDDYKWAFDDVGLTLPIPIQPTEYYSIAREANGNTTLCHRIHGDVLLFAPDHSLDFIEPLDGCPEYTLYRIDGIGHFRDWVETIARQWLTHVAISEPDDTREWPIT